MRQVGRLLGSTQPRQYLTQRTKVKRFGAIHAGQTNAARAPSRTVCLGGGQAKHVNQMGDSGQCQAVNVVTDWVGDPGAVVDYGVRFTRPVPVPDPGVAVVEVVGVIGAIDAEARTVRIDLTVTFDDAKVLGKAQMVVTPERP